MKRIIVAFAMLMAMLVPVGMASPAFANECTVKAGLTLACGSIYHYTPDDGLDSAIKIRCDYGDPATNHLLYEGEASQKYCKDTDRVYVGAGEEIWCNYGKYTAGGYWTSNWQKAKPSPDANNPGEYMDATGWYKINDLWSGGRGCTKRAD